MKQEKKIKEGHLLTKESKEFWLDRELAKGINTKRSLLRVIKLKCLDCCCGSLDEVRNCPCANTCFLHPYRLGKNPFKPELTDEQRKKLSDRAKVNFKHKPENEDEEDTED